MYRLDQIKHVHLEITSKCNARCPMCLRTVCGGKTNPQLPLTELDLEAAKRVFQPDFISQLDRIYMCGNYGDPIAAKDTLEVLKYFRSHSDQIRLELFTNGGVRKPEWWQELAKNVTLVHFSIDGLADTNHIYRRGTHFDAIMENVKAYIGAGGKAYWDFIVFKHNEHQVEEVKKLSKELGFERINIKKTGRFFSNERSAVKPTQVVYDKEGNEEYFLEMPEDPKYHNKSLKREEDLVAKYGSLDAYLDRTPVSCKVDEEKSLYISAEGLAFPCCWTGNQLYPWYFKEKAAPIWKLIEEVGGKSAISAIEKPLKEIVEGPFFQKLIPDSWPKPSIKDGKLKVCAKTCGTEFDPFKDQFN